MTGHDRVPWGRLGQERDSESRAQGSSMSDFDQVPLRPLRESENPTDAHLAWGAELLASVGPLERSAERRRQVWRRLNAKETTRSGFRIRPAHLIPALVLVASAASAAIGHYWNGPDAKQTGAHDTAETGTQAAAPGTVTRTNQEAKRAAEVTRSTIDTAGTDRTRTAATETAIPAASGLEARSSAKTSTASSQPTRAKTSTLRGTATEAQTKKASNEEAALLLEALEARRKGNVQRMDALATQYRKKHPGGALEEEAMGLSLEAAAARHDPKTRDLARAYLTRFPHGRFQGQAKRALELGSP